MNQSESRMKNGEMQTYNIARLESVTFNFTTSNDEVIPVVSVRYTAGYDSDGWVSCREGSCVFDTSEDVEPIILNQSSFENLQDAIFDRIIANGALCGGTKRDET